MKFTKAAALVMSLSIVGMSVCACQKDPEPVSSDINVISTQNQNNGQTAPTGGIDANAESQNFVFDYKGIKFIVNTAIDEDSFANEDYDVKDQASCAGQGMAKVFTFKGGSFFIETTPSTNDVFPISIIALCDDTVATAEGIYIGSTIEQVKAAYGEPETEADTVMTYSKGSSELVFNIANGAVTGIFYKATEI